MADIHPEDMALARELVASVGGFDWYSSAYPHAEYNSKWKGEPVTYRLLRDESQPFYLVEVILPPGLSVAGETTSVLLAYPIHQPKEEE